MSIKIVLLFLVSVLIVGSCKSKKEVTTYKKRDKKEKVVDAKPPKERVTIKKKETIAVVEVKKEKPKTTSYTEIVSNYIQKYSDIAKNEMKIHGIPASITLAQGILESGAGRADLCKKSNNHFGIKCHTSWNGERVYHDDDTSQECFRKYNNPENSFKDHSLFLSQRSRYRSLFSLPKNDYKSWAKGLRKAGYATDPKYPEKLIGIIERYSLFKYDQEVLNTNSQSQSGSASSVKSYTVQKGDTLYSISKKHQISIDDLMKLNHLTSNSLSIGQVLKLN